MPTSHAETDRTVRLFQDAAELNRETDCRHGNVVRINAENGDDVVVSADIHGNRLNFERLLSISDLGAHPRRHLVMQEVCHGGPVYPETDSCMSHLLLEDVARMKVSFPERFHFLLSNHEWAEMLDFPITKSNRLLNLTFRTGIQQMYGPAAERVREAMMQFVSSCPLAIRIGTGTFVTHSAPDRIRELGFDTGIFERALSDADLAPHGSVFRLLWGRDFSAQNGEAFANLVEAQVLIHGHEPCPGGSDVPNPNQVILDCCGHTACYVTLPAAQCLSQAEIVNRIQSLW